MDELILEFRQIAEKAWGPYGEQTSARNYNRCFDQLKKIATKLKENNRIGELSVLLDDPAESVRYETAGKLLPVSQYTQKAEEVLEKIGEGPEMLAFCAEQALKLWRSGKWMLDY